MVGIDIACQNNTDTFLRKLGNLNWKRQDGLEFIIWRTIPISNENASQVRVKNAVLPFTIGRLFHNTNAREAIPGEYCNATKTLFFLLRYDRLARLRRNRES